MVNDRIADMLTRIRNANQMKYDTVEVLGSKMTCEIARILKEEGYISEYKLTEASNGNTLTLSLKDNPYGGNHIILPPNGPFCSSRPLKKSFSPFQARFSIENIQRLIPKVESQVTSLDGVILTKPLDCLTPYFDKLSNPFGVR